MIGYQIPQKDFKTIGVETINITNTANNFFLGYESGLLNTSGEYNVGVGYKAINKNISGTENTALGYQALKESTSNYNTGIGANVLIVNTGSSNTAVGRLAMFSNSSGTSNTAVGRDSGRSNTTGSSNVFLGKAAGYNVSQKVDAVNTIGIGSDVYTTSDNQIVLGNDSIVDTQLKGVVTINDHIRSKTSIYRRYYHLTQGSFNPGASGATRVNPNGGNTVGGWQLDAASEILYMDVDVHGDWDGASDLELEVYFEKNTVGGSAGDTVDLKAEFHYKGVGDTTTKTQTVEVATVVDDDTQYTMYKVDFVIDWDYVDNVVEEMDLMTIALNLETDTSECDDIIINHAAFYYNTNHIGIEDGDV